MLNKMILEDIMIQINEANYEQLLDIRGELTFLFGLTEVTAKKLNPDHEQLQILQIDTPEN